jgi:SAM-dependent methyltransferase
MTTITDDGRSELRQRLHAMWTAVAPGWAEHAGYADARGTEVAERMLDLTATSPGDRVLELACGPGGLGLAAAARGAEVVLSDVAPEMVAIGAARADGLPNVSARVLDVEAIDEPDEAYDVVLCREGLMFATDPARAAAELRRVLRPGGRASIAVWGPREQNPWLGMVFDAVSAQTGEPVPPPGVPGPFSLGDADALAGLLEGAGLADVTVEELPVPLRAGSFEEWWTRTTALAGPLSALLARLPEPAKDALKGRVREATRAYESPAGIELPGLSLIAYARRVTTG